jgi:hypothetical protein
MPHVLKRNALIVFGLAILFWWSFMFAKHDPHLRGIIPFSDDPYDAVGSFGIIVGILIALLSLVRAFRPYRKQPPTIAQYVYLLRSQEAVVLAVFLTLLADAVAMVRHPSQWVAAASRRELMLLLGGLLVITLSVQWLIGKSHERESTRWGRALVTALIATCVLAVYPEHLIHRIDTHLLTVVAGDVILFASIRVLLTAFFPDRSDERLSVPRARGGRALSSWHKWTIVVAVGVLVGGFAFVGEMSEGGGPMHLSHVLLVACVFVGLGLAGIVIAYALLATPLGLKSQL